MARELTNKFNEVVTNLINTFFDNHPEYDEAKNKFISYNRFKIVYNDVGQKLWFGNTADQFVLTNDSSFYYKKEFVDASCLRKNTLPQFSDWGLPAYLGFTRCPTYALSADEMSAFNSTSANESSIKNQKTPRFYYGDVDDGDNGYWLLPSEPGASVYFIEAPFKISFMGPAYFYMEIAGLNCIDETSPWNLSLFTSQTNQTNSVVNSSFAKIAVPTTPLAQWFDRDSLPYKFYYPPAERMRRFYIKLRYHNGQIVNFGEFNYSFVIEFTTQLPQLLRSSNSVPYPPNYAR
jgi:hypothetical protein